MFYYHEALSKLTTMLYQFCPDILIWLSLLCDSIYFSLFFVNKVKIENMDFLEILLRRTEETLALLKRIKEISYSSLERFEIFV